MLTVTVFSIPNFQVDRVKITYSDCFCSPKGCHCNHQPLHSVGGGSLDVIFPGIFLVFRFCSKICPNFMTCFRGVVSHISWLMIHQTKPASMDYWQPKWFLDWSTYYRYTGGLKRYTWFETPCSSLSR